MDIVYLDGEYLPVTEAKVSVLDRGFIFGDGIYEVIPVYTGKTLGLDKHLKRLAASLAAVNIQLELASDDWQRMINELIEQNGGGDQSIYVQITRGVQQLRDHTFNQLFKPTVFMMSSPIKILAELANNGIKAITLEDNRWHRCQIKSTSLLPNVLLKQRAIDRGAMEAILTRDGLITEGATSNVFIVLGDVLYTAPKNLNILAGVTRDLVLDLAVQTGVKVSEEAVATSQLSLVQEIWITSSTKEILPVVLLDNKPVGDGNVGAYYRRVMRTYQHFKQQLMSDS